MSTASAVRSAWNTRIWTHATVTAMTEKIYDYDLEAVVRAEGAPENEITKTLDHQEVNFFQYLTVVQVRRPVIGGGLSGPTVRLFEVQVSYFREHDPEGDNYNTLISNMETVDSLVTSQLTGSWNSTVDFYEGQAVSQPALIAIQGRRVWVMRYTYAAQKQA